MGAEAGEEEVSGLGAWITPEIAAQKLETQKRKSFRSLAPGLRCWQRGMSLPGSDEQTRLGCSSHRPGVVGGRPGFMSHSTGLFAHGRACAKGLL